MEEIILPTYLVGLLASVLTELIKLVPKIGKSDVLKSLTAVILVALGAIVYIGWSWANFFIVMAFAFVNYKMLVQPVAVAIKSPSQNV